MILRQNISAVASELGVQGRHFSVIEMSQTARVRFSAPNWSLETDIKQGLALDFSAKSTPFHSIEIWSDVAQTVDFWAGDTKATDSSITGTIGIGAGRRVSYLPVAVVTNALAVEILALDLSRKLGTFSTSGVVFVDNATTGIRLEAGLHVWENGQPLKLIAESADVEVRAMDEGY